MPAPLPLPSRSASVSALLDAGSRIWRATLPKCLPLAMIALVVVNAPLFYAAASGQPITNPRVPPKDPVFWIYYAAAVIAYLFVGSIAIIRQRALALTGQSDFRAALMLAAARLPALVAAMVLSYLAVVLGTMLLVLPGIYIGMCLFVIWYVVLFDTPNPWRALVRSVQLVHPLWWKYCASILIALVVMFFSVFMILVIAGVVVGSFLSDGSAAGNAIVAALGVGIMGAGLLFVTAVGIVLHSAASSSD
jgi:hypothetical protein